MESEEPGLAAVRCIAGLGLEVMLLNPLWSPAVNLNVVNEALLSPQSGLRQLASTPSVRHQVIVVADIFFELAANVGERANQVIQPAGVGVNKHLISVSIGRKTERVIRFRHSV